MKLTLPALFMVACCCNAAQVELSWTPKPTNALAILSTTNVNYTIASLTETTNRVRQQWYAGKYGNILSSQILNSWAYYYTSLQDHALICPEMLSNWQPFALIPAGVTSFVATVDTARMRFFTVQDDSSGSVGLGWQASPPANIVGYRLYYGGSSRNYTNTIDLGKVLTWTVAGLVRGQTYWFAVTADDSNGKESVLSSEISYTVPKMDYSLSINRI